jgi:hypothetical protein
MKDCGNSILEKLGTIKHSEEPRVTTPSTGILAPFATSILSEADGGPTGKLKGGLGEAKTFEPQSNWILTFFTLRSEEVEELDLEQKNFLAGIKQSEHTLSRVKKRSLSVTRSQSFP